MEQLCTICTQCGCELHLSHSGLGDHVLGAGKWSSAAPSARSAAVKYILVTVASVIMFQVMTSEAALHHLPATLLADRGLCNHVPGVDGEDVQGHRLLAIHDTCDSSRPEGSPAGYVCAVLW